MSVKEEIKKRKTPVVRVDKALNRHDGQILFPDKPEKANEMLKNAGLPERCTASIDYEFIKTRLSPCGLHCGKCFAFSEGEICRLSKDLKENFGDFDMYAERFVNLLDEPSFLKYPEFKEMLNYFSSGKCKGCRQEKCVLFKNCNVRECSENKRIDFCFQCPEFPCNNTGFDENLQERWKLTNIKMKECGVEAYYEEIKNRSRY